MLGLAARQGQGRDEGAGWGAPAGRAGGRGDEGVGEERTLGGHAVECGGGDEAVEAARWLVRGVGRGVATPVVGEGEHDVRRALGHQVWPCRFTEVTSRPKDRSVER